jgi:outer membrane receptor for ferrienterochelin and colicins
VDAGLVLRHEAIRADRVEGVHRTLDGLEVYAQGSWPLGTLSLSPGLRYTANEQWGSAVTPRVAALWRPVPAVALRASVGAGYRAPDFKELYYDFVNSAAGYAVTGNPALQPERSTNVSLGVEVVGSRVYGRLSAYDNRFRDFIDYRAPDVSGTYTYGNIAHGTTRGAEVQAGWATGALRVEAEYAYLDARDTDTGEPLLNRAAHTARFTASGLVRSVRVSGAARYTGRTPVQRDTFGATTWRDPFVRLDLRLMAPLPWALTFTAGVDNLLDRTMGDTWPGYTGRQVYAGLTWRSGGR